MQDEALHVIAVNIGGPRTAGRVGIVTGLASPSPCLVRNIHVVQVTIHPLQDDYPRALLI